MAFAASGNCNAQLRIGALGANCARAAGARYRPHRGACGRTRGRRFAAMVRPRLTVRGEPLHFADFAGLGDRRDWRSEEHTSAIQSLMRLSYDVLCLKKNKKTKH